MTGRTRAARKQGKGEFQIEMQNMWRKLPFFWGNKTKDARFAIASLTITSQRTNTANIIGEPRTYVASSEAATTQKILDIDCRGLDLVDFVPDVRLPLLSSLAFSSQSSVQLTFESHSGYLGSHRIIRRIGQFIQTVDFQGRV